MSITGSLLTYENNNHIVNKLEKHCSNIYSSNCTTTQLGNTSNFMGNLGKLSSNSNILTNDSTIKHKDQAHPSYKGHHLPANYMNSKRNHAKYNNMCNQLYPDHNNYLHLNSLWSIWYGVLITLFQGYLAVHGASRFLGCSLIPWTIEPVAELNLQIILSGLVFVLLPFFFTSAVFKVGNIANDGVKLGKASKEPICSMVPHDGLAEESRDGALRILWTHGGPTAAFIHILIAMCLLLPRLLLEGRIIENGLLPKETIWRTEIDFMTISRRNFIAFAFKSSTYQRNTSIELREDEKYFNDTLGTDHLSIEESTNFLDNKFKHGATTIRKNIKNSTESISRYATHIFSTVSPSYTSILTYGETNMNATSKIIISTTDTNDISTNMYESIKTIVNSTQTPTGVVLKADELNSFSKHISFHSNQQQYRQNHHNGNTIRKYHRQRKISSPIAQRRNHQQYSLHRKLIKSRPLKDNLDVSNPYENFTNTSDGGKIYKHSPTTYELFDYGHARVLLHPTSSTIMDSNIHIIKPEKLPVIIPSTPLSSNSKIIEIKQKPNKKIKRDIFLTEANKVEIEPEYLVGEFSFNHSNEINSIESSTTSSIQTTFSEYDVVRLDGFAGMLQLFFGIDKPIDLKAFSNPPSAEFINLLFALLVWCVRYPSVFWTTAKSFATIFSVQMIASAADIIFSFAGISTLFKLQIYSQEEPTENSGLILNASVTLALFLLSVLLILSSSMILYLYGHSRLSAKIRNRSIISLSSNQSWTYFAHCASMCYILALCVVKAPLLNDLSAIYRNNLHCPTFMAALVTVMHILLWIIIWICLTAKRKWSFKLPPLDAYTIIGKSTTQPLLTHAGRSSTNTTQINFINPTTSVKSSSESENTERKLHSGNSGNLLSNVSTSDILNDASPKDIYWPKIIPSSPKLKVTFNEVTSTSDDDHHRLIGEYEENDGKRSPHGTSVCFAGIEGEIDEGEYATLKSAKAPIFGIPIGDISGTENSVTFSKNHILDGLKVLHLSEHDELPPSTPTMASTMTIANLTTTVVLNSRTANENCLDDSIRKEFGEDNISEQGKLLESVQDDSVTYASTCGLEPPFPPPPPKTPTIENDIHFSISHKNGEQMKDCEQVSSSDYLISPLIPVRVAIHTNEAHFALRSSRRADSGVPQEVLTPRSDTNSCGTESTISPPERAPSDSSSGVHSAEEREIEVIIRPRIIPTKPISKLPVAIQEEPNGRCTNMRMSSFTGGYIAISSTLPLQRSNAAQKIDYSLHCSTMPLPINNQNHSEQETHNAVYAISEHSISKTQTALKNISSFKAPLYANSGVAMLGYKQRKLEEQSLQTQYPNSTPQQVTHIPLSNGIRYSNANILRRHTLIKTADSQYNQQIFSKIGYDNSLAKSTIYEDRDSANYSMISDQESLYTATNSLQ